MISCDLHDDHCSGCGASLDQAVHYERVDVTYANGEFASRKPATGSSMSGPDFDASAAEVSPERLAQAIGARAARSGDYHCPSPAHENGDRNPSLSINRKNGRTVAFCHSCGLKGTPVQVSAEVWGMAPGDAANRLASELGIGWRRTLWVVPLSVSPRKTA